MLNLLHASLQEVVTALKEGNVTSVDLVKGYLGAIVQAEVALR
jgi:Asp-tRNA(Asn)/Glu-tRNA(Gln) amidotransferase A subunit family amidase